tara:strand:- start:204 stop:1010 length:807 start_codon:yes stop_codon:yes gene_type:complete
MGAAIYWYPRGSTTFQTLSLTRLSDLQVDPAREVKDAIARSGFTLRSDLGSWRNVRIISERITDAALIRDLRSFDAHLRAGGRCAFVRDTDKAIAWSGASSLSSGDLSISLITGTNPYPFNASAALALGDELSVEDVNPDHRIEFTRFSSISGSKIVVQDALKYSYTNQTLIRYADFYPVLMMSEEVARGGRNMLSEYRRNWTLDLQLVESPGEVNAVNAIASGLASPDRRVGGGGFTLETILSLAKEAGPVASFGGTVNQWNLYGLG